MDPTASWRELTRYSEQELVLDEAALLIAQHANPELDLPAELRRLDELAASLGETDVESICQMLFGALGIRGDTETYDDPRNSFLDQVLDRRRGIPISLSVLLIEIGRRCGLPLEGVGMPGHFLVRDPAVPEQLIDAFGGGQRLDLPACRRLFRMVAGADAVLEPAMLRPTSKWSTIDRMLANLEQSYARRSDHRSIFWVARLRAFIPVIPLDERALRADRLAELGGFPEAAGILLDLSGEPGLDEESAQSLRQRALLLQARLN